MSLLRFEEVSRSYRLPRTALWGKAPRRAALLGASFTLEKGEILGIVGESGSGKSTLARLAMGFEAPDTGQITLFGQTITREADIAPLRPNLQMVFQDPYSSLDPRKSIGWSIGQPLRAQGKDASPELIANALESVGLQAEHAARLPHSFSGGQRQRIAIARALIANPQILIADEAVSALDVSVQAQILNLLLDLQEAKGLSMIFISHDLNVVASICDRLLVLHQGQIVESGKVDEVLTHPQHSYTQKLVLAAR